MEKCKFVWLVFLVLIFSSEAYTQNTGGHLCGPEITEKKPRWILRFEIIDQESHTPVPHANLKIIRELDGRYISWIADRRGVAVLIVSDPLCIPDLCTVEITHTNYRYQELEIGQSDFVSQEDDRRILLEGHLHNWTHFEAFPSTLELINKVRERRYQVGMKLIPSEFGFNWPNYAPSLFEYRIELQSLRSKQPRLNQYRDDIDDRNRHNDYNRLIKKPDNPRETLVSEFTAGTLLNPAYVKEICENLCQDKGYVFTRFEYSRIEKGRYVQYLYKCFGYKRNDLN